MTAATRSARLLQLGDRIILDGAVHEVVCLVIDAWCCTDPACTGEVQVHTDLSEDADQTEPAAVFGVDAPVVMAAGVAARSSIRMPDGTASSRPNRGQNGGRTAGHNRDHDADVSAGHRSDSADMSADTTRSQLVTAGHGSAPCDSVRQGGRS